MREYIKVPSAADPNVFLKVVPGHFATATAHISCYMDITTLKTRCSEARGIAELLAQRFTTDTLVDTIVCLDDTQVIGAFLAEELTKTGILNRNAHKTIYVITPEYSSKGQMIFRDNMQMAIKGKNVLVLLGSVNTGGTLATAIDSMQYYGAVVTGAAAIFSAVDEIDGIRLQAVFHPSDVGNYASYQHGTCPMCARGEKLDALVNSYGYSELK